MHAKFEALGGVPILKRRDLVHRRNRRKLIGAVLTSLDRSTSSNYMHNSSIPTAVVIGFRCCCWRLLFVVVHRTTAVVLVVVFKLQSLLFSL